MNRRILLRQFLWGIPAGIVLPSLFNSCKKDALIDESPFTGKVIVIGAGASGIYAAHLLMKNGKTAEHYASDATRKNEGLGWKRWGKRFIKYLNVMEKLFWPDLIILGGGASNSFVKFKSQITIETPVKPAAFLNQAGIVGAALYAQSKNTLTDT